MRNCWASRCARPRPLYGPSIAGRRRSRRPRGGILLVSLVLAFAFRACIVSAQLIGPDYVSPTGEETCWVPCKDTPESNVAVPLTNCKLFYVCRGGKVTNRLACSEGRSFDVNIGACNHENLVNCVDPTCPPTDFPTTSPTYSPSENPTASPTESPTDSPTVSPTESPTPRPQYAMLLIQERQSLIEQMVFKSYTAEGIAYPSIRYDFDGLVRGLQVMGVQGFGGDFQFMLWDSDPEMYQVGLVNLAAFLANAMVEGIADDTCDELNWQQVAGRYALSNACGQEGRSYQDETCGIYSCIVDPSMEITAVHAANDVRAPPPFECRPGTGPNFHAGYWDTNTGTEVKNTPYANTAGRIDIEGCCYWGRGVLLSRGACNIGKLDYFLGARAAREGRRSLYPDIDFCNDPEATCSSAVTDELRWTASLFEWAERVQRYNSDGWNYEDELFNFFNSGMADDDFINAVSRVFYLGCHESGCSNVDVRELTQRKQNFYVIINEVFGIDGIKSTTKQPTRRPTPRPLAPFVTPKPTPEPLSVATPVPTPRPIDPQTQLNPPGPEPPLLPPPTYPPLPTAPYPTVPIYPTPPVPTPRPVAVATPRPTTSVPILMPPTSDSEMTEEPTFFDTLVSLDDNGACRSFVFFMSLCSPLLAVALLV